MSEESTVDEMSQSGEVNATVDGDLSVGRDIVGRDSVVSTITTNVFESDWVATRGLVVVVALAVLGLLVLVWMVVSRQATSGSSQPAAPAVSDLTAAPIATFSTDSGETELAVPTGGSSLPVELPDGSTVTIIYPAPNKFEYTILQAQRERLSPGRYLLRLRVHVWNQSPYPMNFWSDSFRLVAGDLRMAPVNSLNKVVAGDETADGDVEFEIDDSLLEAVLTVSVSRSSEAEATKQLRLVFP